MGYAPHRHCRFPFRSYCSASAGHAMNFEDLTVAHANGMMLERRTKTGDWVRLTIDELLAAVRPVPKVAEAVGIARRVGNATAEGKEIHKRGPKGPNSVPKCRETINGMIAAGKITLPQLMKMS